MWQEARSLKLFRFRLWIGSIELLSCAKKIRRPGRSSLTSFTLSLQRARLVRVCAASGGGAAFSRRDSESNEVRLQLGVLPQSLKSCWRGVFHMCMAPLLGRLSLVR